MIMKNLITFVKDEYENSNTNLKIGIILLLTFMGI